MTLRIKILETEDKIFFEGTEEGTLIQYFKDEPSAPESLNLFGKGVLSNKISEHFFYLLSDLNVQYSFIRSLNLREQLIYLTENLLFKVVVRNIATPECVERLGMWIEGESFDQPILEFYLENKQKKVFLSEELIQNLDWATEKEIQEIKQLTYQLNTFLKGYFLAFNLKLAECEFHFGRIYNTIEEEINDIVLISEITPATCRLWDISVNEFFQKELCFNEPYSLKLFEQFAQRLNIHMNQTHPDKSGLHEDGVLVNLNFKEDK